MTLIQIFNNTISRFLSRKLAYLHNCTINYISLSADFEDRTTPQLMRGASMCENGSNGRYVNDKDGVFESKRLKHGEAYITNFSISLTPLGDRCLLNYGDSCDYAISVSPNIWYSIKRELDISGFEVKSDKIVSLTLKEYDNFRSNGNIQPNSGKKIKNHFSLWDAVHRCSGPFGEFCNICHSRHLSGEECTHDEDCAKRISAEKSCTCEPIELYYPYGSSALFKPMGENQYAECNCGVHLFRPRARLKSHSSGIRVVNGANGEVSAGDDFPASNIEPITENSDNEYIDYEILDENGSVIDEIRRKIRIRPNARLSIPNETIVDGFPTIVKCGSYPTRTNLSMCVVSINHLPDNNYRLRGHKIRFAFNNSDECSVEQTEDFSYEIDFYGYQYSEEKGDAYIVLETYNGEEVARVDLTVLWGEISMRCEQEGSFSSDNEALYTRHAMFLGLQHNWERHIPHGDYYSDFLEGYCNIVEFKGMVHPGNFANSVYFTRDCVDEYLVMMSSTNTVPLIADFSKPRGQEPRGNDPTSITICQDRNPMPNGNIYDNDEPGIGVNNFLRTRPIGTYIISAYNFLQYCYWNNKRCSDDFVWSSRVAIKKTSHGVEKEYIFVNEEMWPGQPATFRSHITFTNTSEEKDNEDN